MKLSKEQKEKYKNGPAMGYYAYTAHIEFYALDIIYGCDDYLIIKEAKNKKLHCLKIHFETIVPYINYYGSRVRIDQIYRY
jgi:hypothetical protein